MKHLDNVTFEKISEEVKTVESDLQKLLVVKEVYSVESYNYDTEYFTLTATGDAVFSKEFSKDIVEEIARTRCKISLYTQLQTHIQHIVDVTGGEVFIEECREVELIIAELYEDLLGLMGQVKF